MTILGPCVGVTYPSMWLAGLILLAAFLHRWSGRGSLYTLCAGVSLLSAAFVLLTATANAIAASGAAGTALATAKTVCTSVTWL